MSITLLKSYCCERVKRFSFVGLLFIVLAALLLTIGCTASNAYATENDTTSSAMPYTTQSESLSLDITIPSSISVGTPAEFLLSASGGSGNYQYLRNFMMIRVNGSWQDDSDWTRYQYDESNSFTYTFVANGEYSMRIYAMDMETHAYISKTVAFSVSDPNARTVEQEADSIANQVRNMGLSSDYDRALAVHDIIAARASYDHSLLYDGPSGVLLRGSGTCESYHRAFAMVLGKLGIPCERAEGNGHVWSRVKLDGQWTLIDLTWDDPDSVPASNQWLSHIYFGMTDDVCKLVHDEHQVDASRPANTLSSNWLIRSGEITKWMEPVVSAIESTAASTSAKKNVTFSIDAPYNSHPTVFKVVYPVLATYLSSDGFCWGSAMNDWNVKVSFCSTGITSGVFDVQLICAHKRLGTMKNDASGHWRECDCGEVIGKENHSYGVWNVVRAATTASDGLRQRKCATCSYVQNEAIAKLKPSNNGNANAGNGNANTGTTNNTSSSGNASNNSGNSNASSTSALVSPGPNGWFKSNGKWYWRNKGRIHTGWLFTGGKWYYLRPGSGVMATGWEKVSGKWYYLDSSGAMKTGWLKTGGKWYYLTSSGAMAEGWQRVGGKWYWLNYGSGAMATGWIHTGGQWYWLDGSGAMATGWRFVGGKWYYMNGSGAMLANRWVGNYYLTGSGAMAVNQWVGRYHVNASGLWDRTR